MLSIKQNAKCVLLYVMVLLGVTHAIAQQVDTGKEIITPDKAPYQKRNPADAVKEFQKTEKANETKPVKTTDPLTVNHAANKPVQLPGVAGILKQGRPLDSLNIIANSLEADPRLDSVQLQAWKSYYAYMDIGYRHRASVFSWQLLSSRIIFCVVILLVLCGIYFAWLQFKLALKQMQKKVPGAAASSLLSEVSASVKELKVSSPVLGVIILVLSLLFFYLYLVHVYPIQETF